MSRVGYSNLSGNKSSVIAYIGLVLKTFTSPLLKQEFSPCSYMKL